MADTPKPPADDGPDPDPVEAELVAYLDGELDLDTQQRVAEHLRQCASCAVEFEEIREASQFVTNFEFQDITPAELQCVHQSLQQSEDAFNWRLYGALSAVAASVLVVGASWLAALPAPRSPIAVNPSPAAEWEQVAANLRVDPMIASDQQPAFADARMADWMIEELKGNR